MSVDDLRARIASAPEPVEAPLLRDLRALPNVTAAESQWFHGWVEIRVSFADLDWNARAAAIFLVDDFARAHVQRFSVTVRCDVPDFTRPARLTPPPDRAAR